MFGKSNSCVSAGKVNAFMVTSPTTKELKEMIDRLIKLGSACRIIQAFD